MNLALARGRHGFRPAADVNGDGTVTVADVQQEINEALGSMPPADDIDGDGQVNAADVQVVVQATLIMQCTAQ